MDNKVQRVKVISVDFDKERKLVFLKIKDENKKELILGMNSRELPIALEIGDPEVVFPDDIIEKICNAIVGKEINWTSRLDKEVAINVDDLKGLGSDDNEFKIDEEFEQKVLKLQDKYPIDLIKEYIDNNF